MRKNNKYGRPYDVHKNWHVNNACICKELSVTYTTQHFQDNTHDTNNAQNILMCNINLHLCNVLAPECFLRCIVSTVACKYSNQGDTLYAITRASCS